MANDPLKTSDAITAPGSSEPTIEPGELTDPAGRSGRRRRWADRADRPTRASATWVALAAGLFFLIVLLVFILQNLHSVKVHFFWANWTVPLAVDLLLATVLGGLVMFAAGALRILQLRRQAKSGPT